MNTLAPALWLVGSTAIISILLTTLYTIIVAINRRDELWSWWHSLMSTVISVLLGVAVAIGTFFAQSEYSDRALKQRFNSLMAAELAGNYFVLTRSSQYHTLDVQLSDTNLLFYSTPLSASVINDAARSGVFSTHDTEKLLELSRQISQYNEELTLLYLVTSTTRISYTPEVAHVYDKILRSMWKNHQAMRQVMLLMINELDEILNTHFHRDMNYIKWEQAPEKYKEGWNDSDRRSHPTSGSPCRPKRAAGEPHVRAKENNNVAIMHTL